MRRLSSADDTDDVVVSRQRGGALVALVVPGWLCAMSAAVWLSTRTSRERAPWVIWSTTDTIAVAASMISSAIGCWAGVRLWRRLRRNTTGPMLLLAALAESFALLGRSWPHPVGVWMNTVAPTVRNIALAFAVVRWPTGRFAPTHRAPAVAAAGSYAVVAIGSQFIGVRLRLWADLDLALPTVGDLVTGEITDRLSAVLVSCLFPCLFLAEVSRRRRSMPSELRSTASPAWVAALVIAGIDVCAWFASYVLAVYTTGGGRTLIALAQATSSAKVGTAAVLLAASDHRRRATALTATEHRVDLGALDTGDPADDAIAALGDPTARLLIGGSAAPRPGRRAITLVTPDADPVAIIDVSDEVPIPASVLGAYASSSSLATVRAARTAEAAARTATVRSLQRDLLDRQDAARRQLERDLHDGIQQQLVALSLGASLLARRERVHGLDPDGRCALRQSIVDTIDSIRQTGAGAPPAAIRNGVGEGLVTLCASTALRTTLDISGDLAPTDPVASPLWYVACEAVSNALKHSGSTSLWVSFGVDDERAVLTVRDDGRGHDGPVPVGIRDRVRGLPAEVSVAGAAGQGTTVRVAIARSPERDAC